MNALEHDLKDALNQRQQEQQHQPTEKAERMKEDIGVGAQEALKTENEQLHVDLADTKELLRISQLEIQHLKTELAGSLGRCDVLEASQAQMKALWEKKLRQYVNAPENAIIANLQLELETLRLKFHDVKIQRDALRHAAKGY